ncbi:MAG: alkaline phosphatase family protein [Actinobacteria bacterium]|nr:MAG: alkaline phosphatase family protein [Actinomycetota bacterium]
MDRRSFLKVAGLSALGAAAARPGVAGVPGLLRRISSSVPVMPPAVDRMPQVKHFVVLMMENHSFDNVLGTLQRPGVDGLSFSGGVATNSNPDANGNPVPSFRLPTLCQDGFHITQSWDASHRQWNGGAMDGFVVTSGREAMGYYTEKDLPVTHALAKAFPVCDRWFCSTMCQTFPNRLFFLAGTAEGSISTDINERAASSPPKTGTIFSRMNQTGVSWRNYLIDLGDSMLWGPKYFAMQQGHVFPISQFFVDAATGTLPSFSIISPDAFQTSEENPQNVSLGETLVWSIATAVMRSPAWRSTALLITYDEHGGYYDHVPPVPVPNPDGIHPRAANLYGDDYTFTGFRVPTILVSPWARANHVSHTAYDHTSMLAFAERKWGIAPMTARDAAAADLFDLFDLSHRSFATPPPLPLPNTVEATLACVRNGQLGFEPPAP